MLTPCTCVTLNTRGLRTALVEEVDFAAGTSSRSTKLVHGGVRYLEKAVFKLDPRQLKLVTEALHERDFMINSAPHLAKSLPILTPCYKWWEVPYYWAGLKVGCCVLLCVLLYVVLYGVLYGVSWCANASLHMRPLHPNTHPPTPTNPTGI